jgi:pimeloyl-ACP methyl ester carboxylesterase
VVLAGEDFVTHLNDQFVFRIIESLAGVVRDGSGFLQDGVAGNHFAGDQITPDAEMLKRMLAFVDSFIRCLGLDSPFVLAGHSNGGEIAWRFALQHPGRIAKLILVAPAEFREPGGPAGRIYRLLRRPVRPLLWRLLASRERFARGLRAVFYDDALVTPDMINRYWQFSRRKGSRAATIARIRNQRLEPTMMTRAGDISAPTLILWGRDDPVFPVRLGSEPA